MPYVEVDMSGAFSDAVVFDLATIFPAWRRTVLPVLDSLYFDADAALALDLYFAPFGVAFDEARVIPIVRGAAIFHESRFCYPFWVDGATLRPWQIRATKVAGAPLSAFARLQWSQNGGGL